MRIRVATWNIHACIGHARSHDPERVADAIHQINPDVIGLQEVGWRAEPTHENDQLEVIAERLELHRIAGPNLRDHRGDFGNALLTPHTITTSQRIDLSHADREPRGVIDATIAIPPNGTDQSDASRNNPTLHALVTHLGLHRAERRQQLRAIADTLADKPSTTPTVLMGDLNEWLPVTRRPILSPDIWPWPRTFPTQVSKRSFPARFPLLALDRIFVRPRPAEITGRVWNTKLARRASDHLPVVADIAWPDTPDTPASPDRTT